MAVLGNPDVSNLVAPPRPWTPVDRAAEAKKDCLAQLHRLRDDVEDFTGRLAVAIDHRDLGLAQVRLVLIDALVTAHLAQIEALVGQACR